MTVKTKTRGDWESWKKSNPLWQWLSKQPPYGRMTRLAKLLGLKRQSIYLWLSGASTPSIGTFEAIAKTTGIGMEEWMEWRNRRPLPEDGQRPRVDCSSVNKR